MFIFTKYIYRLKNIQLVNSSDLRAIENQGEGKGEFGVNLSVLGGGGKQLLIITVYPT